MLQWFLSKVDPVELHPCRTWANKMAAAAVVGTTDMKGHEPRKLGVLALVIRCAQENQCNTCSSLRKIHLHPGDDRITNHHPWTETAKEVQFVVGYPVEGPLTVVGHPTLDMDLVIWYSKIEWFHSWKRPVHGLSLRGCKTFWSILIHVALSLLILHPWEGMDITWSTTKRNPKPKPHHHVQEGKKMEKTHWIPIWVLHGTTIPHI